MAKSKSTGKQKAVRIPLDYFKSRDRNGWWKLILVVVAPLIALGWWLGNTVIGSDRGAMLYNHGPIHNVHLTWEQKCEVCHQDFVPIGEQQWASRVLNPSGQTSDALCTTCHAGPVHHDNQKEADVETCAGCHRDHRGRFVSMVRLPDTDCTRCHSNLQEHATTADLQYEPVINRFDQDHPEFAIRWIDQATKQLVSERLDKDPKDPSDLKFNHKLHMTKGMGQGYKLEKIGGEDRARYAKQGQKLTDQVQLDCTACHVLDAADYYKVKQPDGTFLSKPPTRADGTLIANQPARSSGSYMMPITYENQCKACHPLTINPPGGASAESDPVTVPHRLQPDKVREFLWQTLAASTLADSQDLLGQRISRRPDKRSAELDTTAREAVEKAVFNAEQSLYAGDLTKQTGIHAQGCTECHSYEAAGNQPEVAKQIEAGTLPLARAAFGKDMPEFRVKTAKVPEVWLSHGAFNHNSHRAVDCKACHAPAYPDSAKPAEVSDVIMLPSIGICRSCHAPAGRDGANLVGGSAFDCTECHRYHNGANPLQGDGALARDAKVTREIAEFLNGAVLPAGGGSAADEPTPAPSPKADAAAGGG